MHVRIVSNNSRYETHSSYYLPAAKKVSGNGNELLLNVKVDSGVLEGVARIKVITDGKLSQLDGRITVDNATQATIVLTAATNFVNYHQVDGNPFDKTAQILKSIPGYDQAKKAHFTRQPARRENCRTVCKRRI